MNRIRSFVQSMRYALRGLAYVVRHEKNFQNEAMVGILVIVAMLVLKVRRSEMVILFFAVFGVLIMEMLNTIVERMVDILKPRVHPYAKLIKDLMAGSVLLTAFLAIITGLIIFIPYIERALSRIFW